MKQLHFDDSNIFRAAALKKAFSSNAIDKELKTVRIGSKKADHFYPGMNIQVTLGTILLGHARIIRCEKVRWISIGQSPSDFLNNLDGRSKSELGQNLKQYYKLSTYVGNHELVSIITFARLQSTPSASSTPFMPPTP